MKVIKKGMNSCCYHKNLIENQTLVIRDQTFSFVLEFCVNNLLTKLITYLSISSTTHYSAYKHFFRHKLVYKLKLHYEVTR